MTLQLAVRITGDATSLKQAAEDGARSTDSIGTAAAGVTQRVVALTKAQREAEAATQSAATRQANAFREADVWMKSLINTSDQTQSRIVQLLTGSNAQSMAQQAQGAAALAAGRAPVVTAQAAASGFRPDQWKNLGFQANDIATSLFSGMPVTQVIAQQGGQVAQVLGDAPGGIAGGLKIVAQRAAGLVTPFAAATASVAALGAAVVYAGTRWDGIQDRIKLGLTGIGRQSGATADDIERSATAAASGNLTRGEARDAALAAASTGKIGPGNLTAVAGLVPGFAKLTGSSTGDAGAELARIFADPTKGAEELAQRIGALSDKTVQYVKALDAQGNRQGAIAELARASQAEIQRAADLTSGWARAWTAVKAASGGALDVVGRVLVGGTPEEELAKVQARITALRQSKAGNVNGADPEHERYLRGIPGMTEEQIQRELYPNGPGAAATPGQDAKNLDALLEREKAITAEIEKRKAAAAEAQSNETSRRAGDAIRGALPDLGRLQDLRNTVEAIGKALADPAAKAGLGPAIEDANRAVLAAQGGIDSYVSAEEKARASEALTIRSIMARTDAEKAAIAAERERLNLSGQAMSDSARREQIEAARRTVLAQSTRESEDRLRGATATNAAAGLLSYPRQIAELEARYRDILFADPTNANNLRAKALERQSIDKEAIGGPMRDANRSLTEQVAALKLQQDAFGLSTEAASRMAAAQQLVNTYTAAGIPISADLKRGIDTHAASAGKLAAAQEDLTRKQREIIGGMDDIRSGSRSALTGIFSDVSQGRSPVAGINSALNGVASRLFDRSVATPLVNGAFGFDGKAGGGMFGDALSGIFGKAQTVSTAQISAGVVNLSGAVSGIPGLGGTAANGNVPGAASVAAGLTPGGDLDRYAKAIRTIESGSAEGNYGAIGPLSRSGDRPYGAYQVMGNNIPSWTKDALGKSLTPDEFLKDKGAQDAVFQKQFGSYVTKYGNPDDAASMWLRGKPLAEAGAAKDVLGTDAASYVAKFNKALPPAAPTAASVAAPLANLDTSLQSVGTNATAASQGVTGLTGDLGSLPGTLTQTSQGVSQLSSSLGSNGGGLMGILSSLFGGGATASATPAVTAATGGHIRGPGTSTSDSIVARLSDGEFVVNAAATKQNLPLLHAINDHRMPAFAEGGPVGAMRAAQGGGGSAGGGFNVQIVNAHSGANVSAREVPDGRGGRQLVVQVDEMTAAALGRPGSKSAAALGRQRIAGR